MYTNDSNFGGDFIKVLDKEFSIAKNVTIASGYTSLDIINRYEKSFIKIAKDGGISRLLIGMAFYEGLSQKKLDVVTLLDGKLSKINKDSGVFVTNGRRYHGKVYYFDNVYKPSVYVGSSNFSNSGTGGNLECTIPVNDIVQKDKIIDFLSNLYSPSYSIKISHTVITVPGKTKVVKKSVGSIWKTIKRYDPTTVKNTMLPKLELNLSEMVKKEKSNLNVYFGKGRLNTKSGKVTPRPWYEIEIIVGNTINSLPLYPKGDFIAYTDDGYIIPMRTQGDYYKNFRSKQSLQIFGIWLKGKLEKKGVLDKYQPVTNDTLEEYGNKKLVLYQISSGKYYMEF